MRLLREEEQDTVPAFFEMPQFSKRIAASGRSVSMAPLRNIRLDQSGFDSPEDEDEKTVDESLLEQHVKADVTDLGNITPDLELEISRLRRYTKEEGTNEWETLKVENWIVIEALNHQPLTLKFNLSEALVSLLIFLFLFLFLQKLSIGYFWLGLAMHFFRRPLFTMKPQYSAVRARATFKGDAMDIGREYIKSYGDLDGLLDEYRELSRNDHTITTSETIEL